MNQQQIQLGAQYLTIKNSGIYTNEIFDKDSLETAYCQNVYAFANEADIDLDEEKRDFENKLQKGNQFYVDILKTEIPWLLE